MEVRIKATNINLTDSLSEYVDNRLQGLDKLFLFEYEYDSMDRLKEITYPDSNQTVLEYEYDDGSRLRGIPGFIDNITYNAKGQRIKIRYTNGIRTMQDYKGRRRHCRHIGYPSEWVFCSGRYYQGSGMWRGRPYHDPLQ